LIVITPDRFPTQLWGSFRRNIYSENVCQFENDLFLIRKSRGRLFLYQSWRAYKGGISSD